MKSISSRTIQFVLVGVLTTVPGAPTPLAAQANRNVGTAVNDAWITTQVYAKFFADPDIKGRSIDVDTAHGVVTLSGTVYSEKERQQAVSKARGTEGVSSVKDDLVLTPGPPPITANARDRAQAEWPKVKADSRQAVDRIGKDISDAWITTKVQSKFYLDSTVKGLKIAVTTTDGVVVLTGSVANVDEQRQAVALAKNTDGVKEVVDRLVVK
jgi:hyperosmotically inducible protein